MKNKKASNGLFMIVGFLSLVLALTTGCGGGGGGGSDRTNDNPPSGGETDDPGYTPDPNPHDPPPGE